MSPADAFFTDQQRCGGVTRVLPSRLRQISSGPRSSTAARCSGFNLSINSCKAASREILIQCTVRGKFLVGRYLKTS